jgi:hypothetical protein
MAAVDRRAPDQAEDGQMGERVYTASSSGTTTAGAREDGAGARGNQASATNAQSSPQHEPLFAGGDAQDFRGRWSDIQTSFVDEPRHSVEQADALVAEVMQRLAQVFADERSRLEQQWDRGADTDTEALRQALRRYRSFFDRLLSM